MVSQTDRARGLIGTLGVKAPCLVATTANITLSGEQTIDGVAVVAEDRVLVKDQTDTTENGVYNVTTGDWVRAPDFDGVRDVEKGTLVGVSSGTTYARTFWALDTADAVPGTDALTFSVFLTPAMQTLTPVADVVSWDVGDGAMGIVTLSAATTISNPTNLRAGESYALKLIQDATGGRLVTWGSVFKWPNGIAPVLSTAAAGVDIASFLSDGTNLYGVAQRSFS